MFIPLPIASPCVVLNAGMQSVFDAVLSAVITSHWLHINSNLLLCSVCFPSLSLIDLVLYCEAFLTTYRTFITPEDLIKKLHYRYPFLDYPVCQSLFLYGCFSVFKLY